MFNTCTSEDFRDVSALGVCKLDRNAPRDMEQHITYQLRHLPGQCAFQYVDCSALFSLRHAKPIPSTPATVCESIYSTATPATSSSSGFASSVWSQSSGGKTPQTSPASSTSSTATELDEGSTQLDSKADDQVDSSVSIAVEDNRNHLEKQGWGGSAASYAAGTPGSSHSQGCGAKRPRERTPRSPQLRRAQDVRSPIPSPVSDKQTLDEKPQALPSDLANPRRKKECLERSQYPRLDGPLIAGAGPRSHRNQLSNSGIEEESGPCVLGAARGGIFNSGMGSPAIFCCKTLCHENTECAEVEVAGNGSDGPEQALTENLSAQDIMDTRGALAQGGSFYPTDQSDGDEMDFDGAEHEPLSSGDSHGATTSASGAEQSSPGKISGTFGDGGLSRQPRSNDLLPATTCGAYAGRFNQQSRDKVLVADPKEDEASEFRKAGVTGDEEFKELFAKLNKHLKWTWGGGITRLSNERWIRKPGVFSRTATVGAEKFAKGEDVVKYVKGVLGLADATFDSQDDHGGGERDQDTHGDSEDDNGDGDKHDKDEAQGDGEKAKTASEQRRPLASTPKRRALQAALEALNPSNAPGVLQQRTTEFNQVLRFVTNSVERASGGSLYLCGVPGTGKTQTMANVQAKVQNMYAKVSEDALAPRGSCEVFLVLRSVSLRQLLSPTSNRVRSSQYADCPKKRGQLLHRGGESHLFVFLTPESFCNPFSIPPFVWPTLGCSTVLHSVLFLSSSDRARFQLRLSMRSLVLSSRPPKPCTAHSG